MLESAVFSDSPDMDALLLAFPQEFVGISEKEQRVALALYRLLATGDAVTPAQLAEACALSEGLVKQLLDTWLGVYRDNAGRVTGFMGLSVVKTAHRMRIAGRDVYAWCAWDTLFLPALIGDSAQVVSRCAQSGVAIHISLNLDKIISVTPATTVLSFAQPDEKGIRNDVISSFCQSVLFFATPADGEAWVATHPGTFLMSVDNAFELAMRFNRQKFPGYR